MRFHGTRLPAAKLALALVGTVVLTACEGTFTGDLASDEPADPEIAEINTTLLGLEFEKSGGNTTTLEFTDGEPVDLMDFVTGTPMRVFTDESLPSGTYTGVRLLFEDEADVTVVDTANGEFAGTLAEGEFADLSFTVADDESSEESFTIALDLRRSLEFDDTTEEYTLTPVLRAVRSDKAAQVGGVVDVDCPSDTTLTENGAVYVFAGGDVVPDDIDGAGVEPYATTRIHADSTDTSAQYDVRFLEPGTYTLAVTCRGDEDTLGVDDVLPFQRVSNVTLDDGESVEFDLD
jgi:hypothetical protein